MQQAGQDAEDHLRGLRITEAKATALLERPFATSWAKTGSGALSQKDSRVFTQAEKALADEIAQIIKQAIAHKIRDKVGEGGRASLDKMGLRLIRPKSLA